MASLSGFSAKDTEPAGEFIPLPAGDYLAALESSEMVEKNDGGVQKVGLKFVWLIVDGDKKGRKIHQYVNYVHPNPEAQAIARGELSAICRACNKLEAKDTAELHNIPVVLKVAVEKRKDTGEMQNRIKRWTSRSAAASTTPAASAPETAPWKK